MKVYRIKNKETGKFWNTRNRKVFETINAAKGSWTRKMGIYDPDRGKNLDFNSQDEYEVVEYVLMEVKELEEMVETIEEYEKVVDILDALPVDWREMLE